MAEALCNVIQGGIVRYMEGGTLPMKRAVSVSVSHDTGRGARMIHGEAGRYREGGTLSKACSERRSVKPISIWHSLCAAGPNAPPSV